MHRRGRTAIGVDIGGRTMTAAQLLVCGQEYRVQALCLLPRAEAEGPVSAADALVLRRVLKRQGFSGSRIVIAAPQEHLLRAALELPAKVSGAPLGQIARMELSRLHNVEPDSFEMAHWELKAPDSAKPVTQTLAVGCPHEAANALLDVFEGAGFDVAGLDAPGAAAARACAPLILAPPEITAIVDLGWHSTSVLFVCGSALLYERSLEKADRGVWNSAGIRPTCDRHGRVGLRGADERLRPPDRRGDPSAHTRPFRQAGGGAEGAPVLGCNDCFSSVGAPG